MFNFCTVVLVSRMVPVPVRAWAAWIVFLDIRDLEISRPDSEMGCHHLRPKVALDCNGCAIRHGAWRGSHQLSFTFGFLPEVCQCRQREESKLANAIIARQYGPTEGRHPEKKPTSDIVA